VTVLFADLKGSMELLADRDPEEARQLLDPVLERMIEAVHRYEGTVNQVMGDGIMALFGAPLAHEDHAVRACYAALRMQERVTRYGDDMQRSHGVPVQIRVGLNAGAVVVRAIDSSLHMDYTAVGQTTHLAARMEQMAKPGSVLITAEALRLAEGAVQVRALGAVPVKGLAQPVEVFELLGAMPTRTRLQAAAARGLTRFVGRQAELKALGQALERTGTGHGQVVAVLGTDVPLVLLQAIAECREEVLRLGLTHLQAAEFLYETRLFPEIEYTFKHALTQQVAYESLLQERRRALHARIVEALEALARDRVVEQVERLAHHALRGEVWDKALAYCRQAGEKALARSAHREAVGSFEQALSVLPHLPETRAIREPAIDLQLALRSALLPSGDFGRILASLREAESLAAALDDPRRLGQVSRFLSTCFYFRGAYDQAIAAAQRALALATADGDSVLHALANQSLGYPY
jgi:class 3 adenylate cyclase